MARQERKVSFTFEDPNGEGGFERVLRKVLIDKLAAQGKPVRLPASPKDRGSSGAMAITEAPAGNA